MKQNLNVVLPVCNLTPHYIKNIVDIDDFLINSRNTDFIICTFYNVKTCLNLNNIIICNNICNYLANHVKL